MVTGWTKGPMASPSNATRASSHLRCPSNCESQIDLMTALHSLSPMTEGLSLSQ